MDNYIEEVVKTSVKDYGPCKTRVCDAIQILHAVIGIVTEAGELMDALKKYIIYGKPLDFANLQEETGDLLWYAALLEYYCGFSDEATKEKNIAKLKVRYPNKFTEHDALNRDLGKERKILISEGAEITLSPELKEMIALAVKELREHNSDYHHITNVTFINKLEEFSK